MFLKIRFSVKRSGGYAHLGIGEACFTASFLIYHFTSTSSPRCKEYTLTVLGCLPNISSTAFA